MGHESRVTIMSDPISYISEPAPERPIPTYVDGRPAYGPGSAAAERAATGTPAEPAEPECSDCEVASLEAANAASKRGKR